MLSDHVAQFMYPNRKATPPRFAAMGAEYQPMLPLQPLRGHWRRPDLRNHRKLVVVDGVIGFTGSQNLIIDHYHKKKAIKKGLHWHELMVRLTGPIVRELDAVFVTDWYSETDELLPLDTSPVRPEDDQELVDAQIVPSGPSFNNDTIQALWAMTQNDGKRVASPPTTCPMRPPMHVLPLPRQDVEGRVESATFMVFQPHLSYYDQLLRSVSRSPLSARRSCTPSPSLLRRGRVIALEPDTLPQPPYGYHSGSWSEVPAHTSSRRHYNHIASRLQIGCGAPTEHILTT